MKFYTGPTLLMLFAIPLSLQARVQEANTDKDSKKTWQDEYTLPTWGVKTNLLYDATTTMNLGVEFRTGPKNSLEIPINWNPWSFNGGVTKIKHILVQPEFRWWPNGTFNGNFFGIHAHGAYYNVGGLPHGPFTQYMKDHRFEGWLAGAGLSWGYRWNFNRFWGLEVTLGIGYAYLDYGKYPCGKCGVLIENETKHYFGPTRAGITLIFGLGSKKKAVPEEPVIVPIPVPDPEPVAIYSPALAASIIIPEAEPVKSRSESGRAYIEFVVGRSEILPDFRGNAAELRGIHDMIRLVDTDPDVTITRMTITGNASPEGSYPSNMSLSKRRAQALKEYLQGIYGFGHLMASDGAGEDWATLEELVDAANLADEIVLLDVIRSGGDHDVRLRRLQAVGRGVPYRQISTEMFPKLRRTDYVIEYDVAPIGTVRGKEILKTRPGNLSLNEMFLIANTYEPGSDAFNEVFDIAARVFPDSDTANINAAAIALERGDTASASRHLGKVKERGVAWYNNMGYLSWLEGDAARAAEYFGRGGAESAGNAVEMEKHLLSVAEAARAEAQQANK